MRLPPGPSGAWRDTQPFRSPLSGACSRLGSSLVSTGRPAPPALPGRPVEADLRPCARPQGGRPAVQSLCTLSGRGGRGPAPSRPSAPPPEASSLVVAFPSPGCGSGPFCRKAPGAPSGATPEPTPCTGSRPTLVPVALPGFRPSRALSPGLPSRDTAPRGPGLSPRPAVWHGAHTRPCDSPLSLGSLLFRGTRERDSTLNTGEGPVRRELCLPQLLGPPPDLRGGGVVSPFPGKNGACGRSGDFPKATPNPPP